MPHRITHRDVDQFRVTMFLLENGYQVPVQLVNRFIDLRWLVKDPSDLSGYRITPEGIRRRHFG